MILRKIPAAKKIALARRWREIDETKGTAQLALYWDVHQGKGWVRVDLDDRERV